MTKEQSLQSARAFNAGAATLSLWAFKKTPRGFTAHSVNTTPALTDELKVIVTEVLARTTEVEDFSLLSQPNEVGCLHLRSDETSFPELQAQVDLPFEENLITDVKHLDNSAGYIIRLSHNARV